MIWVETQDRSSNKGRMGHLPVTKAPNLITLKQPKSRYHFLWNELSPCHIADVSSSKNSMHMLISRMQTNVVRKRNVLLNATLKAILSGSRFLHHDIAAHFQKVSMLLLKFNS
jgi:hypothetical protein